MSGIKVSWVRSDDQKEYHSADLPPANEPVLITSTLARAHGVFKSASRSAAGTTIIVQPNAVENVILTDMIISTDRVNGATVVVRFSDGTNTENIYSGDVTDAPINFAISFQGHIQGWSGARLEVVTTGTVNATVFLGYYVVPRDQAFGTWDDARN